MKGDCIQKNKQNQDKTKLIKYTKTLVSQISNILNRIEKYTWHSEEVNRCWRSSL